MRYCACIAYDGTNYSGFQIQPDVKTVQGEIEKALKRIFKTDLRINFAGRTDAGVHAFEQVIDFPVIADIETYSLKKALNSVLPEDIRIKSVKIVDNSFHSRYSAKFREYVYFAFDGEYLPPFLCRYVWHVKFKLDVDAMRLASRLFVGYKDFSFVANEPEGKNCTREVYFLRIKRYREFVVFHIRAGGFLRGMVRNIVGLLVGYSANALQIDKSGNIIFSRGNLKSFKAPACGLFLRRVAY
ncbi:tRNA pseudouridine synthase A [Hippea maritima DSM 10411]|uniref:tRNA pseudouridine synthase A n=1 Tax=Hippea maritima (strain ATCC 700847 / DSM 10411 / MH2) TaxID=760142 RepID=F2LWT0_HIPMA|nr:tRNA pseudouridine synthase A [Hippea maritima DSM 10411]